MAAAHVIAPPACGGGAGAGGIFPFRLAGQPIGIAAADLGMGGAGARVDPGDIGLGIFPVETHGRPARRLDIGGRGRKPALQLAPAQAQQRIAGLRLIAGDIEKCEKFRAGDGVFGQREGLDRHHMLRPLGIKPPRLVRRTAHQEFSGRDPHHLRTFRTFAEFTVQFGLATQKDGGGEEKDDAQLHRAASKQERACAQPVST